MAIADMRKINPRVKHDGMRGRSGMRDCILQGWNDEEDTDIRRGVKVCEAGNSRIGGITWN